MHRCALSVLPCLLLAAASACSAPPAEEPGAGTPPLGRPADAGEPPDAAPEPDATAVAPPDAGGAVTVLVSGVAPGDTVELGLMGEELAVSDDGVTAFQTRPAMGAPYELSIVSAPPGVSCFVTGGAGRMDQGSLSSAVVDCLPAGAGRLRIEEVGPSFVAARFIELRNVGATPADLSRYALRTLAAPPGDSAAFVTAFALPARSLPPGGLVVLRGDVDGVAPGEVGLRTAAGAVPAWSVSGFVEILVDGRTVDFVRFGGERIEPKTARHFSGSNPPAPTDPDESLRRGLTAGDSNRGDDFTLAPPTPGRPDDRPGAAEHAVNVFVYGLDDGKQLVLAQGGDALPIDRSGYATFATPVAAGAGYRVTVARQPAGARCHVTSAAGTVADAAPLLVVDCLPAGSGRLRINEIGPGSLFVGSRWVELSNAGDEAADLSRYQLATVAVLPGVGFVDGVFELPPVTVPVGGTVIVRGDLGTPLAPGEVGIVLPSGHIPSWNAKGFVELLAGGGTVDFVRFGDNPTLPRRALHWTGGAAPALQGGLGLSRAGDDSNGPDDFELRPPTMGYANDIVDDTDDDADGIPDAVEQPGRAWLGLDVYAMGARPGRPDVFVEIDWMKSSNPAVKPRRDALDRVRAMYAARGVELHFDAGDLFDRAPGIDPADYDLGGGEELPAFSGGISLADNDPATDRFYDLKTEHMDPHRLALFRYVISGEPSPAMAGAAGIAEIGGNDVALLLAGDPAALSEPSAEQARVLAHELGHNLGLRHGGDEDGNFKPNYLSIMNYLYRAGVPDIGPGEGGPYYDAHSCKGAPAASLTLDFSDGTGAPLDERAIVESHGLGRAGSAPVDFNCNGKIESKSYPLDLDGDGRYGVLHDHDDWGTLELRFSGATAASAKPGGLDDRGPAME